MKDKHGNPVPLTKLIDIPPVWLAGTVLMAVVLHWIAPIARFSAGWIDLLGTALLVLGVAMIGWSAVVFGRAKTPIHPRRKPSSLLTSGPFAFSRNPIYLAMVAIALGVALWLGSLLPLICPFVFGWIITTRFIAGEEHFIEREFGDEWRAYAAKTRRWL